MGAHSGPADWWTEGTDKGREHVATKGIVTDGLVLNLDASVSASYPGTGTTWYDLSGNSNHCALVNGPLHLADNNGSFDFDGSNDHCVVPFDDSLNNDYLTLSVWIKSTFVLGPRTRHYVFDYLSHNSAIYIDEPNTVRFYVRIGATAIGPTVSNAEISQNSWKNIVGTYNGSEVALYLNGNKIGSSSASGVIAPASADGRLMDYILGSYNTEGLASNFMQYNRGITEEEVKQNFNALRNRYGI